MNFSNFFIYFCEFILCLQKIYVSIWVCFYGIASRMNSRLKAVRFPLLVYTVVLCHVPQKVCFLWEKKKQNQKTLKKQPHVVKPWPCSQLWKEKESLSCLIPPVPRAPPQNSWVTNGTGPNKAGGTAKILKNTRYR